MKTKTKKSAPVCVFCSRSNGVQFAIFNPRFQPFGTACVECESTLPEGTKLPGQLPGILPVLVPELTDKPHALRETAPATKAFDSTNPFRISAARALVNAGMNLEDCSDSIIPACCSEGCEVEPDGVCEHGCPSVLLARGLI